MGFVHLHVHSEYTLLESTCRIEELVRTAKERGFSALALTDKNVLYGAIPFYKACKRHGINPIIGMEVSIQAPSNNPRERRNGGHCLVFLAQNFQGYQELVKLSTEIQSTRDKAISREALTKYRDGLFVLSGGPNGDIERTWEESKDHNKISQLVQWYKSVYGNRFFIELQDHSLASEKSLRLEMVSLSKTFHIPILITNNVYYLSKEDANFQDCLFCIKQGDVLKNKERSRLQTEEYYLKTEEEMLALFPKMKESIELTQRLAAACHTEFTFNEPRLPKYPIQEALTAKDYIRKLCLDGLNERYTKIKEVHRDRLDYELRIIDQMGFNDYFLIVWDFMNYARKAGIFPGPGRGSAAGSLVAYLLHITDVDPIEYGLLFERFLNPERITMPDIDIDFPDIHREHMIRYVSKKYGTNHVAQIITFGTLAAKAVIRDTGKVLEVKSSLIDRVVKFIPSRPGVTIESAWRESQELRNSVEGSPELRLVFRFARALEGLPRHTSTHAAGIIISEDPLTEMVPLQEGHDEIQLTQYPMEVLEELGLLKMDFLGLRNLTLIETILDFIEQSGKGKLKVANIPLNDPKTFSLLCKGDTTGVFQLESDGIREVLRELKPTHFEDIVAVNALYRPGPMSYISHFIEGKHGKRKVTYPHPDLESILKATYGVIVYQEQIIQIASTMAGFSLGEADLLRSAVSKKKRDVLEKEQQHFVQGSINKGYEEEVAKQVYDLIVRFADYGFNRSHAVAYSFIAYQLAYLKANYPKEFMASLMSSVLNHPEKLMSYIQECRKKNIAVIPPSINHSGAGFMIEEEGIRFGMSAIKNVGYQAVQEICEKRGSRPYRSLFDLCERVNGRKVNRRALEALIFAGALDDFGVDRAQLLATLDHAIKLANQDASDGQVSLQLDEDETMNHYAHVPPLELHERLEFEKEALGFYLSAHPLDSYQGLLQTLTYTPLSELRETDAHVHVAAYVEKVKQIKTKKGSLMAFLTLSDPASIIEAVVFPKNYEGKVELYHPHSCLYVEGLLEQGQSNKLIIEKAVQLKDIKKPEALYVKVEEKHQADGALFKLQSVIQAHPGSVPVILYYEKDERTLKLPEAYSVSADSGCLNAIKALLGENNVRLKA